MEMLLLLLAIVLFPVIRAWHNITYDATNNALSYQPSTTWRTDRVSISECGSWPPGRWAASAPANITLYFEGVDIHAFVLFDGSTNPIYTIQVDDEPPVRLGENPIPSSNRCDPVFSKKGMPYSKHRVILALTKERPFDVTDLKFQGFTTWVPDNPWDNVPFNSTIPYSNSTLTNGTSSTVTLSAKMIQIIVWTSVGVVSLLLIACCCWCASLRGNKQPRQQQTVGIIGARLQYSHITVSVEDRTNNTNTRPEFYPSPPPYQGREINHGGSNGNTTAGEDIDLAMLKPINTQESPSVPSTPKQPPFEHNSSYQSQKISDNAGNDAATALRTMYMRTLNGPDTAASNRPVYNPAFQPPTTDENRDANSASGWGYVPASRLPHRQYSSHEVLD